MPVDIRVEGLSGAVAGVAKIQDSMNTVATTGMEVFSALPYAYGIETGFTPRGRLARRVGGAFMFLRGVEAGLRGFDREIAQALPKGGSAVVQTYLTMGRRTVDEVRNRTPRVSGRLAGSVTMRLTRNEGA